jgi:hypothetical protein
MPAEEARQFQAGIAGRAQHRGLKFRRHPIRFQPSRSSDFPVEAYLSIMMHKYSFMVNHLAELSSRKDGRGFLRFRRPSKFKLLSISFPMPARRNIYWTQPLAGI